MKTPRAAAPPVVPGPRISAAVCGDLATPADGVKSFVRRQELARLLGVRVATIGKWDRTPGREVGKPVYLSQTCVAYERSDVERFLERLGVNAPGFLAPQERGAGRPTRTAAGSAVLKAPTPPTPDGCGRREEPEP